MGSSWRGGLAFFNAKRPGCKGGGASAKGEFGNGISVEIPDFPVRYSEDGERVMLVLWWSHGGGSSFGRVTAG